MIEGRFFHKYLMADLDLVKKKLRDDFDWFQIVCGYEGYGKSTLGINCCYYVDPTFNIDRICMEADEFIKALKKSKKYQAILLDEAGTQLYSREAMTSINRLLTKAFMIIRQKNLFVCIVLPSFFMLDSYIRNHRINSLLYCYKRGKFRAYNRKYAKVISIKGMKYKDYNVVHGNKAVWGHFNKPFPSEELRKQYLVKKNKYVNSFLKNMESEREGFYKVIKFSEITGYSLITIKRWIKSNKIKYKKIGGHIFIPKIEVERVVDNDG